MLEVKKGEVQGDRAEREATVEEILTRATETFNDTMIRLSQRGVVVKLSIRTVAGAGRIAKCRQVIAAVDEA